MTDRTEAIILKSFEAKEADRVYIAFSRQRGKIKFIGIGTRKPKARLASGLEPLTKSEILLVKGRMWDRAKGVLILNQYEKLKDNLEKLIPVQRIISALERIIPDEEPNEPLYYDLKFFLRSQNEKKNNDLLGLALLWKFIAWAGYTPGLFCCNTCQEKLKDQKNYKFVVPTGIVCEKCEKIIPTHFSMSQNTIKVLRVFLQKKLEIAGKIKADKKEIETIKRLTCLMGENITGQKIVI